MVLLRYALPAIVVVGGLVVMSLGSANELEGGAGIVSAGLAIYFINWLFRVGVAGEGERDAEERAREHYDKHGFWPGEGAASSATKPGVAPGQEPAPHQERDRTAGAASARGRAARAPRRR